MRIALIVPVPPDRTAAGGLGAFLHASLSGLVEEGHQVTVVTAAGPGDAEQVTVADLRRQGYDVIAVPRHMGTNTWRRRLRMATRWAVHGEPWRTVWFSEPGLQLALDTLFSEHTFDVIDVQDNAVAGYRLASATPTVLTELEVRRPRSIVWRPGPPRQWATAIFREADWARWPSYQRKVWARFDAVRVFTERDAIAARVVSPEVGTRLHVTPFGITLPPDLPVRAVDADTVAFLGDYSHAPNVDAALWLATEIFPKVRAAVPGALLRLAGPHPPPCVRALASASVEVLGLVADADDFLAHAAVVAAPVRIGGGMRVKVLHAMALGKAMVTTSRGTDGLEEFAPLPLAVSDDTDELAGEIVRLLLDDVERTRLGSRARDLVVAHFSPAAFARRSVSVYDVVIAASLERVPS